MQTRTKESKKRLQSLILLTAFTAVLLIVSTYAWFTTQKSVSIANIRGRVQVAEGLEISLDGEKWTQTIDLGDTEHVSLTAQEGVTDPDVYSKLIYKPYATHENNVPGEFKPVSSSGETFKNAAGMEIVEGRRDKMVMLAGTYDGERLRNVTLASDAGGDYFAFDVFIRNSSKTGTLSDVLQLNHTSSAWVSPDGSNPADPALKDASGIEFIGNPLYGIQNTVRVGFARYGADVAPDPNKSNEEIMAQTPNAQYFIDADESPADIIKKTDLQPITGVSIWEPNANAHSKYAVDNTKLLFDQVINKQGDGSAQNTYLTSETSNKFFTKTLKYASFGKIGADGIDVFDWDNTDAAYTDTLNFLHTTQTTAIDGTVKDVTGKVISEDKRFPMIEDGIQNLKLVETISSPNTVDLTDQNGVDINSTDYLFEKLKTKDLTIAANSITKFRIYVWIEGQDPDCTNYASSGGGLEINLSICKGEEQRSVENSAPTDDRVTTCMPGTCKDKVINGTDPVQEGRDAKCDVCGGFVSCTAAGADCVDTVRDGKCDVCGLPVACDGVTYVHEDTNPRDAYCDYCGEAVACEDGTCEDNYMYNDKGEKVEGHDGLCDYCGKAEECTYFGNTCDDTEDTIYGHRDCDYCGKDLTCAAVAAECIDEYDNTQPTINKADGKCDHCGEPVVEEEGN